MATTTSASIPRSTNGHLTLGQCVLEGRQSDEILFSCHACHPSLCNDNLSGHLGGGDARAAAGRRRTHRYTYRFLFIPGTIGAITWLARHEEVTPRDQAWTGPRLCRRSWQCDVQAKPAWSGDHRPRCRARAGAIGRSVRRSKNFSPYGYDERQYCSPGFNLPVGVWSRTPHGCFPEYHTSARQRGFRRCRIARRHGGEARRRPRGPRGRCDHAQPESRNASRSSGSAGSMR